MVESCGLILKIEVATYSTATYAATFMPQLEALRGDPPAIY
jgi:hypothetical protein